MNATTVLTRHHQRIEQLICALEHERFLRTPLLRELSEELTAHLEAERSILQQNAEWCTLESMCAHGETLRRAREVLAELVTLLARPGNDRAFLEKLTELHRLVLTHRTYEEDGLVPAFEQRLSVQGLERLGREIEATHASVLRDQRLPRS